MTTHWGDTVRIERWHTRWRDRWRTDTIYIAKTDSVRVPYAVPSEQVAATRLTWWQQTRMYVGDVGFGLLIIFVAAKIIRRKWRYNDRT